MTHSHNLLENTTFSDPELEALHKHVYRMMRLHPDAHVYFYTDDDCIASLHRIGMPELIPFFEKEKQGMYKADLCRGAALYEHGGIYCDVDLGVRLNLWEVLAPETEFATVHVHSMSQHPTGFFQAFLAATPRHVVIRAYLEDFLEYYRGNLSIEGPLGVLLLRHAFDRVQPPNAELWQEVLYNPHSPLLKEIPPPTWGTRRACKFIVVAKPTLPLVVPMYSRIGGSRMCPNQASPEAKK